MEGDRADSRAAWDRHSLARERATFGTANLLICVLVPVWSGFDFFLEPALAPRFLVLRIADVLVTLLLWRAIARSSDLSRNRLAMAASLFAVGVAIVAMLARIGTAHYALYAFGFSLVFWGAGLVLFWPPYLGASTFAALLVAHAVVYSRARPVPLAEFVGAMFYLVSGAVISTTQLVVRRRLEREVFEASFTLGARNDDLASTVAMLAASQARLRASSTALASSLDIVATADRVIALAVPSFATWGILTVTAWEDQTVRVAAHSDPALEEPLRVAVKAIEAAPASDPRDAEVERIVEANPGDVKRVVGPKVGEVVSATSLLVAPLIARGERIGTLVLGRSDRAYDLIELAFAEEIARRAALALDNARLYAAQESARAQADAANRAKDEFLASVSHELRTPLSAILGWSKMLSTPGFTESKRGRALETIERNAVAMAQLIDDLLDISRIVSGKFRLETATVQLAPIVEAAIDAVRPAAESKRIRIATVIERSRPIRGDPARLQQVFWNLISNAVKFTSSGGTVDVELRDRQTEVEIVVRDSGKGIEPRFLPHVFEPFQQAEAGRPTSGLGLGLAIVERIVELHGGRAAASSEGPGHGATFSVVLPASGDVPESVPPPQPQPQHLEVPVELEGLRVLVVEDEPDMRRLVEDILRASGSNVVGVSTVAEAIDRFDQGEIPDVVISDIGMEGASGYELIRRIRERPASEGGRVPAAALTAYTRAADRRRVLKAGFELHVPKPIEPAELVSVVASLARFADTRPR